MRVFSTGAKAMVDEILQSQVRAVGEEAVGAGGLFFHLLKGIEGIGVVEHAGLAYKVCLPGMVELVIVVGLAAD